MINLGTRICFKAMCLYYDSNTNEYHFMIPKIRERFVLTKNNEVYVSEKSTMFRANCVFVDNTKHVFNLEEHASGPIIINFSKTHKKFLIKSRILHLLYFRKKF